MDSFPMGYSGRAVHDIAKVTYEANRAWAETVGDFSFKPWHQAPDWQRETNVKGVIFHIENPDAGPEASHNSWMAEKLRAGWVYGLVKDPDEKTHPCIVPFDQLPPEQQAKDILFRNTVHALKAAVRITQP